MASNYEAICEENRRSYGTKGAQKSGRLAAELYDDRTHFIFELLQNAEDALGRRGEWNGSRKVAFALSPTCLALSHFGKPFDEADVRSVCDIAESTKSDSSIGRFGLGFKSVYTVTDLPEIHSGDEDFAIEDYVFPKRTARLKREEGETQILLPLRPEDVTATQDIATGFRNLGPGALLFLRHISEINWSVEGGASGFYLRTTPESLGPNVQRITVIGKEDDRPEVDQNWLVFHRDVYSGQAKRIGRAEIAFSLIEAKETPGGWAVQPLAKSPLVVFFPTVVESDLGFLVQGPYRTTPSRDNVPPGDPWNQYLVEETSSLLVEAMCWMRDHAMLDISALRCLPLDGEKFVQRSRFAVMFNAVLRAFREHKLLPAFGGGYVTANEAKLARTQELRELFSSAQIAALFGSEASAWLSGDITLDRAPDVRQYVIRELEIDEITPMKLVPCLTKPFLEAQSDDWVVQLYQFLNGQHKVLGRHLETVPLIRLEDGTHVVARENGSVTAFLPSTVATGFPTIRAAVCTNLEARQFLGSLGITEPDPVDDVIWNVLPKYRQATVDVEDHEYAADIERIRVAFNTDSTAQREKLRLALRESSFVMVIDAGDGNGYVSKPGDVYIATERLQQLFAGVPDVFIVDNAYDCLRGEEIRNLLVSCGASRYLEPQATPSELQFSDKLRIRREAGLERASREIPPEDFTLRGLAQLLDVLPALPRADAANRSRALWEALADLEAQGAAAFYGSYRWSYSHESRTARFDAKFLRELNEAAWVPSVDGELVPPSMVLFDTLGWKPNSFLLSKISFKPPVIDQLAKEVGIEPAALDLLRKLGITNVADLTSRLGIAVEPASPEPPTRAQPAAGEPDHGDVYDGAVDLYGEGMPDIPPGTHDPDGGDDVRTGAGRHGQEGLGVGGTNGNGRGSASGSGSSGGHGASGNRASATGGQRRRGVGHAGGRPFISYIGTHPGEDDSDPDGLDQEQRMRIESGAIDLIIGLEPTLRRAPEGNPGFDLFETDSSDRRVRWVEVKSMTGTLHDRPVGMSRTQFDFAREKGDAYWLYVVEHATDPTRACILKICNPVAHTQTFTFDSGWRDIAQVGPDASP